VVNVPINCAWQDWLEATFPSSTVLPASEAEAKEKKKAGKPVEEKKVVNVQNILIKFVFDQTIGAAFNIPLFLASIGLAKGQGVDQIISTIQKVSTSISYSA
jgi:protein Mpv17